VGKDKLRRFAAIKSFENVIEAKPEVDFSLKGSWRKNFFKNNNPIVLELGCGKGEYSLGLAKHFPNKNFIGVDLKGNRIYIGAKEALELKIKNVAFLRTRIDFITDYFAHDEVDEIWLTFSDPQKKKPRKRLTSSLFIDRYRLILKPGGIIHLKTDSDLLFEFTLNEIKVNNYHCREFTWDLYNDLSNNIDQSTKEILCIKTHYEKLFTALGYSIKYCKFEIH
jgi:tRNA (guanine-N7-)-methyltransferase